MSLDKWFTPALQYFDVSSASQSLLKNLRKRMLMIHSIVVSVPILSGRLQSVLLAISSSTILHCEFLWVFVYWDLILITHLRTPLCKDLVTIRCSATYNVEFTCIKKYLDRRNAESQAFITVWPAQLFTFLLPNILLAMIFLLLDHWWRYQTLPAPGLTEP